jgi:hypothetical protein
MLRKDRIASDHLTQRLCGLPWRAICPSKFQKMFDDEDIDNIVLYVQSVQVISFAVPWLYAGVAVLPGCTW